MSAARLLAAAVDFAAAYHQAPELVAEQRGWSRRIALQAEDSGAAVAFEVQDGRIAAVAEDAAAADVAVRGAEALLVDILRRRRGAAEPYLFGELTVLGAEADFLRLDYITTRLGAA